MAKTGTLRLSALLVTSARVRADALSVAVGRDDDGFPEVRLGAVSSTAWNTASYIFVEPPLLNGAAIAASSFALSEVNGWVTSTSDPNFTISPMSSARLASK